MVLIKQCKLVPTTEQAALLDQTMREYIALINDILDYAVACTYMPKLSSATVKAKLPSALRDQCRIDAKSIYKKTLRNGGKIPVLRKPVAIWNNQNYKFAKDSIDLPLWVGSKCKRVHIEAVIPDEMLAFLSSSKLGTLRVSKKGDKYIAQFAYEAAEPFASDGHAMGIDLGIKCPAVAVTSTGATRFYGNGRKNKFVRRRHAKIRKKLGKAKKLRAIRKLHDKEQRWMRDQDHKISRAIIRDAVSMGITTIKLETLSGIRQTARTSRKNNHSLHNWSFYRLSQFIEYKAALAGIKVVYVNPAYTSQTCPICGKRNHAKDRTYQCSCGYSAHRDRVGAVNILAA